MGAILVVDAGMVQGATFRVWAPVADAVFLNGTFNGVPSWDRDANPNLALRKLGDAWWAGFVSGAKDGDPYKFYVVGKGSSGFKRDPYARERDSVGNCFVRSPDAYPWHDAGFRPPAFNEMVIYQLHVGTFYRTAGVGEGTFLDVIEKIPYFAALGVNVLQLLPVQEFESDPSRGYNGSDYFAPEFRYAVTNPRGPIDYLGTVNQLLAQKGKTPVTAAQIASPYSQLKALVDLCHVYGIAVNLDVVYNHAGGFDGDDECIFFWDREDKGDNNRSLYFTAQSIGPGGLPFALWKGEVRSFLVDNASYLLKELHIDGFRYDEISLLVQTNANNIGWSFCQDLTNTVRYINPAVVGNAEFWPNTPDVVIGPSHGAGFDVMQSDGLREAIRGAVSQAAGGRGAYVDLDRLAGSMYVSNFPSKWKAVQCAENHDIVFQGNGPRIPRLADPSNPRTWYARSRSRVALGILLTAPGIPHVFMGQEFLEDKQWNDDPAGSAHIYWDGLLQGDKSMVDFLRFTQDLIGIRRDQPALSGELINVFYRHNADRIMAYHRWIEGVGRDVVIVMSFNESTFYDYRLGFPGPGRWAEVFNSDIYDNWVNPLAAGNGGQIFANGEPLHGLPNSAAITIPANAILVFAR